MRSGRLNDILDDILVTSSDEESPPQKPSAAKTETAAAQPQAAAEADSIFSADSVSDKEKMGSRVRPTSITNINTDSDSDELPARQPRPKRIAKAFVVDDDSPLPPPRPADESNPATVQRSTSDVALSEINMTADESQITRLAADMQTKVTSPASAASALAAHDEECRPPMKPHPKSVTFVTADEPLDDPPVAAPPAFLPNMSLDVEGRELIDVLAKGVADYRGAISARAAAGHMALDDSVTRNDSSIEINEEAEEDSAPAANAPRSAPIVRNGTPSKSPYSFVTMSSDEKKHRVDDSPASMFTFETASAGEATSAKTTARKTSHAHRKIQTAPAATTIEKLAASGDSMQDMYDAAVRARDRKLRRYDEERQRRESLRQRECPFTPEISAAAKEIRRARSAVPHCYEDGKSFKIWLMQQKRTDDEQLTFEPTINDKSRILINKWRSLSSRPVLPADTRLYEDGKRRLANIEAARNVQPSSAAPVRSAGEIMSLVEHLQSYAAKKDELLLRLRQREDARHRPQVRRVDPVAVVERLATTNAEPHVPITTNCDLTFEPRVSFVSHTIAERKKIDLLKLWFTHLTNGSATLSLPIEQAGCRAAQAIDAALSASRVTAGNVDFATFSAALQRYEMKYGPQQWSHSEPVMRLLPQARRFVPQISEMSKRLVASHGQRDGAVFSRLFKVRPAAQDRAEDDVAGQVSSRSTSTEVRAARTAEQDFTDTVEPNTPVEAVECVLDERQSVTEDILSELQRAISSRMQEHQPAPVVQRVQHEQVAATAPEVEPRLKKVPAVAHPPAPLKKVTAQSEPEPIPSKVDLLLECAKARNNRSARADKNNAARLRQLGRSLINQQLY